jgi:peptidoglycan/LPS O-acetylase OafA/YrhL
LKYRREIDGLRALAIVPVVFFHAGFVGFSGGYVGVDVFFVISGYLISTILMSELSCGTYSIRNFYERRARRILPALFVMLVVTLPLAYLLLHPSDLRSYAKSLLGAVLFVANVTSYMQSGYFDAASDIKPLMHLWSLAIEEQYYLFFPVLLALLWRCQKKYVVAVVAFVSILSLWVAEVKLDQNASAAFFYLHSRAWELGLGALLAFFMYRNAKPKWSGPIGLCLQQSMSMVGLLLIIYAITSFDKSTRFPGLAALVPTLGALLVIAFATPMTMAGRLLGSQLMVGVGLISYSAYLWHQPIFAFARYQSPNHLAHGFLFGLVALTGVMAYLSWRFVEAPFREKGRVSGRHVAIFSFLGIALFCLVAISINEKRGLPERYPKELASAFDPFKVKEGEFCQHKKIDVRVDVDVCEFGDLTSAKRVLLLGDSHASSLLGELDQELKKLKIKGERVRLLKCNHSIPGMSGEGSKGNAWIEAEMCLKNLDRMVETLGANSVGMVVSVRWSLKMYPVAGLLETAAFDNQEGGIESRNNQVVNRALTAAGEWTSAGDAKKQAVWTFLNKLKATDKQVFVVYPVPEVGWDLPLYNFATYLQSGTVRQDVSTSYALYKERNKFVIDMLDDPQLDGVYRIRPEDFFCKVGDEQRCMAQVNWQPFYYDSNHLASEGARPIAAQIASSLALK